MTVAVRTFCPPNATAAGGSSGSSQPRQQRRLANLALEARAHMPPKLLLWVKQLSYFLMHFPDVEGGIAPLRRLHRLLLAHRRPRSVEVSQQALNERDSGGA